MWKGMGEERESSSYGKIEVINETWETNTYSPDTWMNVSAVVWVPCKVETRQKSDEDMKKTVR